MEDRRERYHSQDVVGDDGAIQTPTPSQESQKPVTNYAPSLSTSPPGSSNAQQISSRFSRHRSPHKKSDGTGVGQNSSPSSKNDMKMPLPSSHLGDDHTEEENSKVHTRRGRGKQMLKIPIPSQLQPPICSNLPTLLRRIWNNSIVQKLSSLLASFLVIFLIKRLLRPSLLKNFLMWMENHPYKGLLAYMIVYPFHMVLLLPGTPLVMGAGFVFKVQYGWTMGVIFCSIVTLFGSLVGSVMCFLLARYCMRTAVRRWSKKYPLFDPIDHAVSDNGFKIMSLIYLTPVIPLGPISYMMGTTSMPLVSFAKAKIAALPFTVLYVYLGAAAGTLMLEDLEDGNDNGGELSSNEVPNSSNSDGTGTKVMHKANMEEITLSPKLMILGILFSIGSITMISIKMKKELQKILDKQGNKKDSDVNTLKEDSLSESSNLKTSDQTKTRQRKTLSKAVNTEGDSATDQTQRQHIV